MYVHAYHISLPSFPQMYAWEDSFEEKITALRNEELEHLATTQTLSVISTALFRAVPTLVALVTFMTYTLAGNTITPAKAFTSLALFSILQVRAGAGREGEGPMQEE